MQSTHLKCTILNFPGSLLAKNSVLPLQGAQFPSLVMELRSCFAVQPNK